MVEEFEIITRMRDLMRETAPYREEKEKASEEKPEKRRLFAFLAPLATFAPFWSLGTLLSPSIGLQQPPRLEEVLR